MWMRLALVGRDACVCAYACRRTGVRLQCSMLVHAEHALAYARDGPTLVGRGTVQLACALWVLLGERVTTTGVVCGYRCMPCMQAVPCMHAAGRGIA